MSSKTPIESELKLEYEVFLSFRGPDTRDKFTDHLYIRFVDAGIRVYRDNEELQKGENIGSELLEGINQSKIAIPIFSKGYAASKWCLNELVKIEECKRTNGLKVMPVFYDVTPSEVRKQTGEYGKIFKAHKKYYNGDTIEDWKKALREVGELSGWDIHGNTNCRQEGRVVKEITKTILRELKKAHMVVTKYLVGLEHHVDNILDTLTSEINGVKIVGIHGMGGIGKTTLAKVIYNNLLSHFESHCFLANIRENAQSKGMEFLQTRLIRGILNSDWTSISNIDEGVGMISERFYNKKVLLVLDDVDAISQLQALMGERECYGSGSRIIITTRDKSIADWVKVDLNYELSFLESCQALQLFSQHAFRSDKPLEEYTNLSVRIVKIAGGLPLALEVFGSLLCGKNKRDWGLTLKKLEEVPRKEVSAKLRISFEALEDQQKHVFLDIACFFIGEDMRKAIYFWDDSEFPEEAIEVLQQMSLIKIEKDYFIWMHDQLRDLGRAIVRQEQNCNRLWDEKKMEKLLEAKMISKNIRGINFMNHWSNEANLLREDLASLPNLKLLRTEGPFGDYSYITKWEFWKKSPPVFSNLRWLRWDSFPHKVYRSNFSVENLVILELMWCGMTSDWGGWKCIQTAKKLKVLDLRICDRLVRTPDFSYHPLLERLILVNCPKLLEIDESLGMLEHLQIIRLIRCERVRKLPKKLSCTESLEELIITRAAIVEIPKWPTMKRLRVLDIGSCYNLDKVSSLDLTANLTELSFACTNITALPASFENLVNLQKLSLARCKNLKTLPESTGDFLSLTELDLSSTGIIVRSNMKLPQSLISLKAMCQDTQIPDLSNLINLKILELLMSVDGDYPFEVHDPALWWIGRLTNLENLTLGFGRITSLHADLGTLSQLTSLSIYGCSSLGTLLDLPPSLKSLSIENCSSLGTLLNLPLSLTSLSIDSCSSLGKLLDLPSGLTSLSIKSCSSLGKSLDLPSGLAQLYISYCKSLTLVDFCTCKSLRHLHIGGCDLSKVDGLEVLEDLTYLTIRKCVNLQRLPDLSNLKMLKNLRVGSCPKLIEIPGRLKSLDDLEILDCKSLERIPDITKSESLGPRIYIRNCGKIKDVCSSNSSNSFRPFQSTIAALHRLFRNMLS